jgi:hypothetical protein
VLDLGEIHHIGLVVGDLEGAMAELSALTGCTWSPRRTSSRPLRTERGIVEPSINYTFTLDAGTPTLELVQAVPNTIWESDGSHTTHHISIWVDDLAAASAALSTRGAPLVSTGHTASPEPSGNAYHRLRCGLLVELTPRPR